MSEYSYENARYFAKHFGRIYSKASECFAPILKHHHYVEELAKCPKQAEPGSRCYELAREFHNIPSHTEALSDDCGLVIFTIISTFDKKK